jgi:hypothetical protein
LQAGVGQLAEAGGFRSGTGGLVADEHAEAGLEGCYG